MNFLTSRRKRKLLKKQQTRKRKINREFQYSFNSSYTEQSTQSVFSWIKNIPRFLSWLLATILSAISIFFNAILFPFLFTHQIVISGITFAAEIPTDAFQYACTETYKLMLSVRTSLKRQPKADVATERKLNQLTQELSSLRKSHKKLKEEVRRLSTLQSQVKIIEKQVVKSIPKLNEILANIPLPPPPPPPMMAPPPPPPLPAPVSLVARPLAIKKLNGMKSESGKGPALPQVSLELVLGAKGNLRSVRRSDDDSLPAPKPLQDITSSFTLRKGSNYSPNKKNGAKNSPQKPIFRLRNTGVLRSPGGTPYKENFEENVDSPANIITNALRNKFKNVRGSPDKSRERVSQLASSPLVTIARDL